MNRTAEHTRQTAETEIKMAVDLDRPGQRTIDSGIPFLDHMLTLFAAHARMSLQVDAEGDLEVDEHHTMEDLGLVLGACLKEALGTKAGIARYGACLLPMDETLVRVALDLSGRPCLVYNVATPVPQISGIDMRLFREFFQALTNNLGLSLHIDLLRGDENHHVLEAVFKGFARALAQACAPDAAWADEVPSTKGNLG